MSPSGSRLPTAPSAASLQLRGLAGSVGDGHVDLRDRRRRAHRDVAEPGVDTITGRRRRRRRRRTPRSPRAAAPPPRRRNRSPAVPPGRRPRRRARPAPTADSSGPRKKSAAATSRRAGRAGNGGGDGDRPGQDGEHGGHLSARVGVRKRAHRRAAVADRGVGDEAQRLPQQRLHPGRRLVHAPPRRAGRARRPGRRRRRHARRPAPPAG